MANLVNPRHKRLSGWKIPAILLLVLVLVLAGLEATNTTHLLHKKTVSGPIPAKSPNKSSPAIKSQPEKSSNNDSRTTAKYSPPAASAGGNLIIPSGTFVSNHRPKLGGTDQERLEQSTCNTTPGAQCAIKFTNSSTEKTLEAKTADSSGSVVWNWDINNSGLTTGSWKVTAIATLNGKTSSAADPITLEVK
jgi:hypothetical protein